MKKMKKTLCGFLVCLLLVAATPLLANAAAKAPVCPKNFRPFILRDQLRSRVSMTHLYSILFTSRTFHLQRPLPT